MPTATIMPAMDGFLFGCDPELFVTNEKGEFVTAEGLIPGTKQEPHKVTYGAVQVDGMAAEFNIDPVSSFEDFDRNITAVTKQLKAMLPKGYNLECVPSIVFDKEHWEDAPDEAKQLGCTPDFNAWTGEVNPPPYLPENPRLRTASGHLHIGWTDDADTSSTEHLDNCRDLVKQLDWYLGGWSIHVDKDKTRRELYGKAGACRYKPYGVEYRVLSNFWLKNKATRLGVWNRMQTAIWDMAKSFVPGKAADFNNVLIQTINSSERSALLERKFEYPLKYI